MTRTEATARTNLSRVANLQVIGKPYASLFLDKDAGQLYIFVSTPRRNPDGSQEYLVASVTSDDVENYISRKTGLKKIFARHSYSAAVISDGHILFGKSSGITPENTLEDYDRFDPEYCYDRMKIKVFLRRFTKR